jgi:hypothetical protein
VKVAHACKASQPSSLRVRRVIGVSPRTLGNGHRKRNSPLSRAVVVRSGKARVAGGAGGSRTHLDGFAIRCITALLPRRCREPSGRKREADASLLVDTVEAHNDFERLNAGAGDESRTRDLNLGKVALYQLSYSR